MRVTKEYITKFLQAVIDGYEIRVQTPGQGTDHYFDNYYIAVNNPDFVEGSLIEEPFLVFEVLT